MKSRSKLKKQIRKMILKHLWTFILIYLPFALLIILNLGTSKIAQKYPKIFIISLIAFIFWCLKRFLNIGVHFNLLDIIRSKGNEASTLSMPKIKKPLKASLIVFTERHAWAVFCIGCIREFWIIMWGLIFIIPLSILDVTNTLKILWFFIIPLVIPAIIKAIYTYNQSQYIYRDAVKSHQKISYSSSVVLSKLLMRGHRIQYLLLQLSFMDWLIPPAIISAVIAYPLTNSLKLTAIIVGATVAIVDAIISPYVKAMELIFYQRLIEQRANQHSEFYGNIMKALTE